MNRPNKAVIIFFQESLRYANRVLGIADQFVNFALDAVSKMKLLSYMVLYSNTLSPLALLL